MAHHEKPVPEGVDRFYFDMAERYQREALALRERIARSEAENGMILQRLESVDQEIGSWRNQFAAASEFTTEFRMVLQDLLASRDDERVESKAWDRAVKLLRDSETIKEDRRRREIVFGSERVPFSALYTIIEQGVEHGLTSNVVGSIVSARLRDLEDSIHEGSARIKRAEDLSGLMRIVEAAERLPFDELVAAVRVADFPDAELALEDLGAAVGVLNPPAPVRASAESIA